MMQSIEAALELRMPPTTLIYTERQPGDDWTDFDKKLAVAAHILKKQTCPKCGQPMWICRSDDSNLDFRVRTATCYSSKALEEARKKREKSNQKNKELKLGEFEYVEPVMLFDAKMPTRQEWLKTLQEE